ncbi:hypothetical protein [Methylobacterium soli]|uniref:Uncharacterized protein n=1 Tax=Methylobacterium soli TaxID=553447 RepID=A0A6L3T058_9HYPH|nr:hypothetical protein [Methylobacterium soli]KAB1078333.1 hypothetical protein F6X53_14655 [Methylobacterium soli]GJE44487.1 hypothetical protein AEGHOMDF_3675 [Methylobacterium soli]
MLADGKAITLSGVTGMLIYGDFAEPKQFYYAATQPRIARDGDAYQFTLVRYDRVRDGQAGMLSFVVDLAPDPAELARARRTLERGTPGAQLTPLPWTSGTVAAAIIGGDPVLATPSLMGDNGVAISLGLTTEQYLLLMRSLDDPDSVPISIVYSLQFEAMRPKFEYSIQFHAERFRDWLQKKRKLNLLFVSFERVETFEELRESGSIQVSSVNQTDEPLPDGVRRAFLSSLQAVLTPLPAFAPPPDGGDDSWGIGYSSETIRDVQSIARRLDCNLRVTGAVARSVHIQGALGGLPEALRGRPVVELPTGISFVQDLTLRCHDRFDGNPLHAVQVSIAPADLSPAARVFNGQNPGDWQVGLTHDPDDARLYACRCDLHFARRDRPRVTATVELDRDRAFVDLQPAAFYSFRRYAVSVAGDFPWDLIRTIDLSLSGPPGMSFTPARLVLSARQPRGAIEAFAPEPLDLAEVAFHATYEAANGADHDEVGLPTGATIFLNPLRERRILFEAAPDMDWGRWSAVLVKPVQKAFHQIWASRLLTLTEAAPRAAFTYWFAEEARLACKTAFRGDSRTVPGAEISGAGTTIVVPAPPRSV